MPQYDVECSGCGYIGVEELRIAALEAWDKAAKCPHCLAEAGIFRRVIRQAAFCRVGGEGSVRSETARKQALKQKFQRSSEKDDMLHRSSKRVNHDQFAEAREAAEKG